MHPFTSIAQRSSIPRAQPARRHPSIDPAEISQRLALEPYSSCRAGEPRKTPTGVVLEGVHHETSWNHVFRFRGERRFSNKLEELLSRLSVHRHFLHRISGEGGSTRLFLELPGDVNMGDDIHWQTMQKLVDLRIIFGVETFPRFKR